MSGDLVALHDHGDVVVVQLRRPEKRNALSTGLEQALLEAMGSAQVQRAGAVVLTGDERAFSAGADTSELTTMTPARIADYYRASGALYETVARLRQPTIAAITGYCLGGGLELALACDLRVAGVSAVFGFPEVGLGILPSSGGLTRVVRASGPAVARELMLLGDRFGAGEARRLRLVSRVVDDAKAVEEAVELAARLATRPALAVEWTKAAIDAAAESSAATSLLIEQLAYAALNRSDAGAAGEGQ